MLCLCTAAAYNEYAGEYHQCRQEFLPGQYVHAKNYAYYGGNYRLYIAVHAYQGRTDAFLTKRYQEVADECCEYYQESPKLGSYGGRLYFVAYTDWIKINISMGSSIAVEIDGVAYADIGATTE